MLKKFSFSRLGRPALAALVPAALLAAPLTANAAEGGAPLTLHSLIVEQAKDDLLVFYGNTDRQVWVRDGRIDPAAHTLLDLVKSAEIEGLDPAQFAVDDLAAAIARAEQEATPAALAGAELALSRTFTAYVAASSGAAEAPMIYEHYVLRPVAPTAYTVLQGAAGAPSLDEYLRAMPWMHPLYAQLRQGLQADPNGVSLQRVAAANFDRVRALPAPPWSRHVVIDAASARLWMYEGGRPVDSMKVVVGKADTQTPLMAGYIRYATLNPYWNVPSNLVQKTIAKNVLAQGVRYLKGRYEVVTDYGPDAEVLDPTTINWRDVANGTLEVKVRQKPSATNAMGDVKFEFPNPQGIYLHDTPDMNLMAKPERQFSNGCVRLEDAERLGRWLFGGTMPQAGTAPEQRVDLPEPVPVFITYLTVRPEGDHVALGPDPYGHDGARLAASGLQ